MPLKTFAGLLATAMFLSAGARAEPGLLAKYSDGKTTLETTVPAPTFTLREHESVHPQLAAKFIAEYGGSLKVLRRATYTFDAPGEELRIDGQPVTGPVELANGQHAIALRYERRPGPARLRPTWSSDTFLPEPLPASVLSH